MLYAYECRHCGKYYELLVPLSDYKKKIECKYCGHVLKRIFNAIRFKVN